MKNTLRFTLLAVFIVVLILLSFTNRLNYKVLTQDDIIPPNPDDIKLVTKLYFVFGDTLRAEERSIGFVNNRFELGVAEELEKGPKTKSFESPFHDGVEILSVEIIDRIAYVNLTQQFTQADYWESERQELFIWSIVNTFAEIDEVYEVQILVEGKKVDEDLGGMTLMQPLEAVDDFNYVTKETPSRIVIEFLNAIHQKRYGVAYDYIDSDSRELLRVKDFEILMEDYNKRFEVYRMGIYFTQNFDDRKIVNIKYIIDGELGADPVAEIYDSWELIEEDGIWKIDFGNYGSY